MNGGFHHPRHPSLDNLRIRNRAAGSNRSISFPQLNGSGSHDQADFDDRFPWQADEDRTDGGFLKTLTDFTSGIAATVCVAGLLTVLVVLYTTVRPFSQAAYRRLTAQLGAAVFLDAIALLVPNIRLFLTGDSDVPSPVGTSIVVSNHLMDGDWFAFLMLGRCVGLRGSVKVFLRNEVLKINQHHGGLERQISNSTVARVVAPSASPPRASSVAATIATPSNGEPSSSVKAVSFARVGNCSGSPTSSAGGGAGSKYHSSPDITVMAKLLHAFLEFPVMSGEDYISERQDLFQLLRSFAQHNAAGAPVHLLLFPEGWVLHNGADRRAVLAKSNEFAKREGRPQLKHLLLPRTTGFNASLESLRESSPVVYDVTMAYRGYDGSLPPSINLNLVTLWELLRCNMPKEIHIRIKRYSMEEVLQDATWLDKTWAEKDRLLSHFARHQSFPTDSRGFCRHRTFDTRHHSVEGSVVAVARLLLLPCAVPFLVLLSIPIFWSVLWMWLAHRAFKWMFPDSDATNTASGDRNGGSASGTTQTPGSAGPDSVVGTPFLPATPFASPSVSNWRDIIAGQSDGN